MKNKQSEAGEQTEAGITSKRLPRFQNMRKEIEGLESKLHEVVIAAVEISHSEQLVPEDDDFKAIVQQGLNCLLGLLCVEAKQQAGANRDDSPQVVTHILKPKDVVEGASRCASG